MERSPNLQSLKTILEAGPLECEAIMAIVTQLAQTLQREHEQKLAHLYLCPKNIWLDSHFEILELRREESQNTAYLAPEQHHGREVGIHSDIYTVGILLFEMATGSIPEGGERPSDRDADLPPWIDALFDHCYAPRSRRLSDGAHLLRWLSERKNSAGFRAGMEVGSEVEETQSESVKVTVPRQDVFINPEEPQNKRRKINLFASTLGLTCLAFGAGFIAMAGTADMSGLSGHVGGAFHRPAEAPWAQYEKALALYQMGQYQKSRSILDDILGHQANFPQAYHLRGNVLTELGHMNAAIVEFDQAINLAPDNAQAFLDRGNTQVYLKNSKAAVRDFQMYLKLAPRAANNAQVRGWIAEIKKNGQL
ncbi:MAG: tetratricopeptide repeat protein [Planctomycetota bacterium]|nr:tetratricopeptide repeat protein [Planctomycetota bacterium]